MKSGISTNPHTIEAPARKHASRGVAPRAGWRSFGAVHRADRLHFAVLACAAACASAPTPLALPPAAPDVRYELAAAPDEEGSPQALHIEVLALREAVEGPALDLAAATIARDSGAPFRGASALPAGARWLDGSAAARWRDARQLLGPTQLQTLGTTTAALAPGIVTRVELRGAEAAGVALDVRPAPADRAIVRIVHRVAGGEFETLRVARPMVVGEPALLFLPVEGGEAAGIAVELRTTTTPPADLVERAIAGAAPVHEPPPAWPAAWRQAFAAVGQHNRRPALLALVRPLGARRCGDVLLIADERALADVTQGLRAVDPTAADAAWQFEKVMWRALLPRLERDDFGSAMRAAARRHLGVLADDGTALRQALAIAHDEPSFLAAVREENFAGLSDRDPSARVRGHEWLTAHGAAVPGYAPLAPGAERRAALRRHAAGADGESAGAESPR